MADVTLNSAVRANLRTLTATTDLMNRTEKRLSTGKEVNSALDNPSNFFTAQSLERRAGDLTGLLDSVSNSVKTLEAADNGISAISDVVEQLKATARSALQSPSAVSAKASVTGALNTSTEYSLFGYKESNTGTVSGLTNSSTVGAGTLVLRTGTTDTTITLAAASTVATNIGLINAQTGVTGVVASLDENGSLKLTSTSGNGVNIQSMTGTTAADFGLTATTQSTYMAAGANTVTLTVGTGTDAAATTFVFGTGAGQVSSLAELNDKLERVGAEASVGTDGKLKIETGNDKASQTFTMAGTGVIVGTFGAASPITSTSPSLNGSGKEARDNFVEDYNDLLDQISALSKDASYNGVNLLNGDDLSVIFNEDSTSKLAVRGVEFDYEGLGLAVIASSDFTDANAINKVLAKIESAFVDLESQSSKFGSQLGIVQTREDFTKSMTATLEDGAYNLTAADTNTEAANLASLQTRQSLIVSALSISNQQEQSILQLLR